jgi:hypothetical protein
LKGPHFGGGLSSFRGAGNALDPVIHSHYDATPPATIR